MSLFDAVYSPAPETTEAYLSLALSLAHKAGKLLHSTWLIHPNDRSYTTKTSTADVVTETDKECERIVQEGIQSTYPKHRFLGEESAEEGAFTLGGPEDILWVCDPIDGTNNFIHSLPNVAVSIGVLRGAEVIAGVVYLPVFDETYYATRGGGAYVIRESAGVDGFGRVKLRTSQIATLQRACIATEMGYSRSAPLLELMQAKTSALLTNGLQSLRMSGSCCANMVHVAAGKLDCYYEGISTSVGPKPWDVAAASIIVTEAGGTITDITGAPFSLWNGRVLAAANPDIAREVSACVNRATDEWSAKHGSTLADSVAYKEGAGLTQSTAINVNAGKAKL